MSEPTDTVPASVEPDPPLGPEPDPLVLRPAEPAAKQHEPTEWFRIQPDKTKAALSAVAAALVAIVFLVMYYSVGNHGPSALNDPTWIRLADALAMSNRSVDPCASLFNFSCGTYNAQLPTSSLFGETQSEVFSIMQRETGVLGAVIDDVRAATNRTYTDEELDAAGLFACVDLEVDVDYRDPDNRLALYVTIPCASCTPGRHSAAPVRLAFDDFPDDFEVGAWPMVNRAAAFGVPMYWLPPDDAGSETFGEWYALQCTNVSASDRWEAIVNTSSFELATRLYAGALNDAMPCPIHGTREAVEQLFALAKTLMIQYLGVATFIADAGTRAWYIQRVKDLPLYFGSGRTLVTTCSTTTHPYDCQRSMWNEQLSLLGTPSPGRDMWAISGVEVNAIYNPLSDAVFIPYAIARPPFYDPRWPIDVQVRSRPESVWPAIVHRLHPRHSQLCIRPAPLAGGDARRRDHARDGARAAAELADQPLVHERGPGRDRAVRGVHRRRLSELGLDPEPIRDDHQRGLCRRGGVPSNDPVLAHHLAGQRPPVHPALCADVVLGEPPPPLPLELHRPPRRQLSPRQRNRQGRAILLRCVRMPDPGVLYLLSTRVDQERVQCTPLTCTACSSCCCSRRRFGGWARNSRSV